MPAFGADEWEAGQPIGDDMHSVGFIVVTCTAHTETLRSVDGLILGARFTMRHGETVLGEGLYWLNRTTDDFQELRPYRVGMFGERS